MSCHSTHLGRRSDSEFYCRVAWTNGPCIPVGLRFCVLGMPSYGAKSRMYQDLLWRNSRTDRYNASRCTSRRPWLWERCEIFRKIRWDRWSGSHDQRQSSETVLCHRNASMSSWRILLVSGRYCRTWSSTARREAHSSRCGMSSPRCAHPWSVMILIEGFDDALWSHYTLKESITHDTARQHMDAAD